MMMGKRYIPLQLLSESQRYSLMWFQHNNRPNSRYLCQSPRLMKLSQAQRPTWPSTLMGFADVGCRNNSLYLQIRFKLKHSTFDKRVLYTAAAAQQSWLYHTASQIQAKVTTLLRSISTHFGIVAFDKHSRVVCLSYCRSIVLAT